MKYIGKILESDFDKGTITFEIEGDFKVQAGKYEITQLEVGNKMPVSAADVLKAVLDWMQSDDCWVNDKDGNKIQDAEISGKNFRKYLAKYSSIYSDIPLSGRISNLRRELVQVYFISEEYQLEFIDLCEKIKKLEQ